MTGPFSAALQTLQHGAAGAVIFYDCNPVYEHPQGNALARALSQAPLSVSTSLSPDETSEKVQYVAPNHHYLESWGDAEPVQGHYNLMQPTISPLFDTRQAQHSFLSWSDNQGDYFTFLKKVWRENMSSSSTESEFQPFFDKCLHDGIYKGPSQYDEPATAYAGNLNGINIPPLGEGMQLLPYFSVSLGSGEQAGNPWLQELPDPITKLCWEKLSYFI